MYKLKKSMTQSEINGAAGIAERNFWKQLAGVWMAAGLDTRAHPNDVPAWSLIINGYC